MALAMTMSLQATAQQPRHRHNPQTVNATATPDTAAAVAYSDTTSYGADDEDTAVDSDEDSSTSNRSYTLDDVSDPFTFMAFLSTLGAGGVAVALLCVILCVVAVLSPFIIIALIIYWLIHRRNREYQIVEKAVENGQPIPAGTLHTDKTDKEKVWQKGIHTTAGGIGLIVLGLFTAHSLIGVGAFIACVGIGQCIIARTSASGRRHDFLDDDNEDAAHRDNEGTRA